MKWFVSSSSRLSQTMKILLWSRYRIEGDVVVFSFQSLKPLVLSSRQRWCDKGDDKRLKCVFNWNKYNVWRGDKGSDLVSVFPRVIALPKSVKLSGSKISINGEVANGVSCVYDRRDWLREIRICSIFSRLSTLCNLSYGRKAGILFHGIVESIGISMYLIPLDYFLWVWYLINLCICCWCSKNI